MLDRICSRSIVYKFGFSLIYLTFFFFLVPVLFVLEVKVP